MLIAPPALAGVVINVPSQRPTIQAAIDAASDGDTVVVAPGTYVENINFKGKAIEVKSAGGPQVTTIDGGARRPVVVFASGEQRSSVLRGFGITNGVVPGQIEPGQQLVVAGAGIAILESSPTITENVITANHAVGHAGGGIGAQGGSALIVDNHIAENGAESGAGVSVYDGTHRIEANVIEGNTAAYSGGGVESESGAPVVKDNYIRGNHAGAGGGLQIYGSGMVVNNVVLANTADAFAGGMGVGSFDGTAHVLNNSIVANMAPKHTGVSISTGRVTLTNNVVFGPPGQQIIGCYHLTAAVVFTRNDVYSQGGLLYDGCPDPTGTNGNVSVDPLIPLDGGSYRPQPGSPVIDAGTNLAPGLPTTDHVGDPRVVDGDGDGVAVADMGAIELPPLTGDGIHPLTPARILDTRTGNGAPIAQVGPRATLDLQVTGRGGVPATGVSAVALNVAVTKPTAAGWLSAWPTGGPWPGAANLNFVAGQTVANAVVVKVGAGGGVSLLNSAGATDIVADVVGWYGAAGARYTALDPARVLDTRTGVGAPAAKVAAGGTLALQVTGRAGLPANGVSTVVLNVAVTGPASEGWVTAWPAGEPRPLASSLNYAAGQTVPNLVTVKVGADGKVNLFSSGGPVDLVADLAGWYGTPAVAGFSAVVPARVLDTRLGLGAPAAKLGAGATLTLEVAGRGGVPASGVSAVVLNVTVTGPASEGWLTAWPAGQARPLASNLNYAAGQTVPNLVVVKVGAAGAVDLYSSGGPVDVVADVAGWYSA